MLCAVFVRKVYGPFIFEKNVILEQTGLEILFSRINEDFENFIFQQNAAPPHRRRNVFLMGLHQRYGFCITISN